MKENQAFEIIKSLTLGKYYGLRGNFINARFFHNSYFQGFCIDCKADAGG